MWLISSRVKISATKEDNYFIAPSTIPQFSYTTYSERHCNFGTMLIAGCFELNNWLKCNSMSYYA